MWRLTSVTVKAGYGAVSSGHIDNEHSVKGSLDSGRDLPQWYLLFSEQDCEILGEGLGMD